MNKKGISLIVLIITIIVIIILAGAVILSLASNNPIQEATQAKFLNDVASYQAELSFYILKGYTSHMGIFDPKSITDITGEAIKTNIPSIKQEHLNKFAIMEGQLVLTDNATQQEKDWFNGQGAVAPIEPQDPSIAVVNKPILAGMKAIIFDTNGAPIEKGAKGFTDDNLWYDYINQGAHKTDGKTSRWANAQALDGSQFVWIPRYAYRIESGEHGVSLAAGEAGKIDVKFLKGTTNDYEGGTAKKVNDITIVSTDYIVHPAFTFGTKELTGIWVAKYEASNSDGNVKIAPNVPSWRTINVATVFDNCFTMATKPVYGFTGLMNGDTHMMKNSEWGATTYLAHSKYGRNGNEITINNNSLYITGSAGGTVSAAKNVGTTAFNTPGGQLASTTGNLYGIYDMSGGVWEFVAGNFNSTLASAGSAINFNAVWNNPIEKAKYFDIYTSYDAKYKGDAVYETSSTVGGTTSWFGDYSNFVISRYSWFFRSGDFSHGASAGAFSFSHDVGGGYSYYGFRLAVAP